MDLDHFDVECMLKMAQKLDELRVRAGWSWEEMQSYSRDNEVRQKITDLNEDVIGDMRMRHWFRDIPA